MTLYTLSPSRWLVATYVDKGSVDVTIRTRHPGFAPAMAWTAVGHLRRLGLLCSPRAWWLMARAIASAVWEAA